MTRKQAVSIVGTPSWWRRALAFVIDFHFAITSLAGLGGVTYLLNANETTRSAWSLIRIYLAIPLFVGFNAAMFLYFAFPLTRGKQTVGCFIMKTKVTPPFGSEGRFTWPTALQRTWYAFRGLCSGAWLRPKRDSEGNTWYDIESGCRVVLVDYTNGA
jgi:uncharacterized RDD family membrane protein YckC